MDEGFSPHEPRPKTAERTREPHVTTNLDYIMRFVDLPLNVHQVCARNHEGYLITVMVKS